MTQRLLSFRTLIFLLVVSTIFFGCTKSYRYKWVVYDETNCADRWERNINNEKLKDNIVEYMDKKGVKIFELEIITDRTPESCTDCTCKTGRRVNCKVKRSDVKSAKSEGFYEQ